MYCRAIACDFDGTAEFFAKRHFFEDIAPVIDRIL